MASSIFFLGRVIRTPGSYTEVDATALEQIGLGANGIVAILGVAEGGRPSGTMQSPNDFIRLTKPGQERNVFRSGDLLEGSAMSFSPSTDPEILGGAQQIVAMKVNPATQSLATLPNGAGDAIDLTSEDYGAFTEQINVTIQSGTNQGKLVTIIFEDVTETADDIGGDDVFNLTYDGSDADAWDTMTAEVRAGGAIAAAATRTTLGLDGDIDTTLAAPGVVRILSSSAADVGQLVTIYGLDAAGAVIREVLITNGTVLVVGTAVFAAGDVLGVEVSGTIAGTVTVEDTGGVDIFTLAPATDPVSGLRKGVANFVSGTPAQLELDAAGTPDVILVGTGPTGAVATHRVLLAGTSKELGVAAAVTAVFTWDGTTTVLSGDTSEVAINDFIRLDSDGQWFRIAAIALNVSVTIANPDSLVIPSGATARSVTKNVANFSKLTAIVLGDVAAARTMTTTAQAALTQGNVQDTIQKVADFFNARTEGTDGFALALVTGDLLFDPDNLDIISPVNVFGPANPGYKADLFAVIDYINTNSSLVTAVRSAGAVGGAPTNTATPVFLAGGAEGVTTFTDFQNALNLLKQTRINSVATTSADPAVHAAIEAHCAFMGGIGRSERDGFAGLMNSGQTDVATKTELKSQIVNLNSRHMRAWGQTVTRFNVAGDRTEFTPPFGSLLLAAMQAGSAVGEPLTNKSMDILDFRQNSTWNPTDDSEELIEAGLVFCENVDGVGRKVVRNITTFLQSDNLAFTEGSVNEAANFATFNFRTEMEFAVGRKGFQGTVNAAAGIAVNVLGLQVAADILVRHRSLNIELIADVLEVSVEIAPVIPINFVRSTIHLVIA